MAWTSVNGMSTGIVGSGWVMQTASFSDDLCGSLMVLKCDKIANFGEQEFPLDEFGWFE